MRRFGRSRKRESDSTEAAKAAESAQVADLDADAAALDDVASAEVDAAEDQDSQNDSETSYDEESGSVEDSAHRNTALSVHDNAAAELAAAQAEHESQLETLRAEVKENYDKYLRAVADLENVKKRAMKERSELLKYGGESLARDLLEVVDSLELALAQNYPGANEELLKGVKLVLDLFGSVFERHTIRAESAVGQPFDPEKHQAMTSVPTTEHPHNSVMQEFRKAYFFKDRLLRPGQVVVATNTAAADAAASKTEASTDESADPSSESDSVH